MLIFATNQQIILENQTLNLKLKFSFLVLFQYVPTQYNAAHSGIYDGNFIYDLIFCSRIFHESKALTCYLDHPLFSGCTFPVWQIFVLSVQEMSVKMLTSWPVFFA